MHVEEEEGRKKVDSPEPDVRRYQCIMEGDDDDVKLRERRIEGEEWQKFVVHSSSFVQINTQYR